MRSFVALDLELTPSSGDQQRIIEVAAVRFRDSEIEASFSSLINPHCPIEPRVAALTGISDEELSRAPSWQEIAPRVIAFLGDDPIVGQSIEFDLACLARHGVRHTGSAYDTYELATLLLPGLVSYDLSTIAKELGVELGQTHRAHSDALVSGQAYLALLDRASRLGLEVLAHVNALSDHLVDWPLTDFFAFAQHMQLRQHFDGPAIRAGDYSAAVPGPGGGLSEDATSAATPSVMPTILSPGAAQPSLQPMEEAGPVDVEKLEQMLAQGGVVANSLPGFEVREEQLRMLSAVAEALNESRQLLVEAGTGTGKSLAYLLPSICYAWKNGQSVVVSTNTINLQDQLFNKDIPGLQQSLPFPFRAALVKGRANYLCLRRWIVLSRAPNHSREELLLLIKTLIWLSTTSTGDKAELNLSATDSVLWSRISAQAESCALSRCLHFRRGNCFVTRARRKAASAHVIVVNHALLLSDVAADGGVLPEYSHLVVDEAHRLEEEATEQLGFTLSWGDLHSFLGSLCQGGQSQRPSGFLPELALAVRPGHVSSETLFDLRIMVSAAQNGVLEADELGRSFFDALSAFLQEQDDRTIAGSRLRITPSVRVQPAWSETEVRWTDLVDKLKGVRRQLLKIKGALELLGEGALQEQDGIIAEMAGFDSFLMRSCSQGEEIIATPGANGIYWINGSADLEDLSIHSAPLHVGEILNARLFAAKDSVVLASATLTTEGSFEYIRERLGLEDADELMLGSPFDYKSSTLLYVVQDMPEPSRPAFQRAVESTVLDLVLTLHGRTLVLFTSHAQLRATAGSIRSKLESEGILVLAHGLDGSRRRLLQAFKSSERAVLMGTSSFWEGIDVVGEALSCLVIVKLPFAVPSDPIFAARSEVFDEPFRQYSVPQTILKFKQGFGRLIRSRSDRGAVVVLDSRIGSKFYGPSFIHSLPRCTVRMGPASRVSDTVGEWLDISNVPS